MATILFYEKRGCATNARQKRMLEAAGHTVVAKSLLDETWSGERLRSFFGDLPPEQWFNRAAPSITSGRVDPRQTTGDVAIASMLADPLLIRRPLLEVEGRRCAGFDIERLDTLLGLPLGLAHAESTGAAGEACSRRDLAPSCPERSDRQGASDS